MGPVPLLGHPHQLKDIVSLAEMTIEGTSDAAILADKPFFDYLAIPYAATMAEAYDDDGSGFVRVSEVKSSVSTYL